MRSCAHFGVKGVVVQDAGVLESGAAIRTAEGGAEHVEPITGDSFIDTLDQFRKAGYAIVSTSSHNGTPLFKAELPKKMVLALGGNVMVCPMRRFPAPISALPSTVPATLKA